MKRSEVQNINKKFGIKNKMNKTLIVNTHTDRRLLIDKFFKGGVIFLAMISTIPLFMILYQLFVRGIGQINFDFFFENSPDTMEAMIAVSNNELIPGGIANGITGTLVVVVVAAAIAIPFGLLVGIYLYESKKSKFADIVRFISDLLQGVPSIVLGILGYLWIVKEVTGGFSALAGGASLSIMMLPSIIKSTEETLNMIPISIKEAALALGVPYYKTMFRVILPTGISGIVTGIMLSISRVLGETAPLMLTTLGSSVVSFDVSAPISSVPLLIWEFYNDPNLVNMIWSASLFLVVFILIINLITKGITKRWKVQF